MLGGKVIESGKASKEADGTSAIEQHLRLLKTQTGRTTFDLREVL